jgi:colanic acid biosynthesis glycosyl transferase WcaI
MKNGKPRLTALYHYFHPDDVVSARHFTDFCQGLAERGWQVEALPCNRGCRDESRTYPRTETWGGITIRRVWRPGLRQASKLGRLANSAWMVAAWCLHILRRGRDAVPHVVLVGTDPAFSIWVAWVVKRLRPGVRIAHWCYDLYPEAPIADGLLREGSLAARFLRRTVRAGYHACDLVADLGSCMQARLRSYELSARQATLPPWALSEPDEPAAPDAEARRELFGDAALGLLYSGNFGQAHSYEDILALARRLRGTGVHFCFAVRGNRAGQLRAAVGADDTNISFAGFAPEAALAGRLAAADVHLASLRPEWAGVVVPSKFFGSLAAGRPVIFAGPRDAAIARWIEEHRLGWVLDAESLPRVAEELRGLAARKDELAAVQRRCHATYRTHFSRQRIIDQWDEELRALLERPAPRQANGTAVGRA